MMTDHEVVQAADHIEAALELLLDIESKVGRNIKWYAGVHDLRVHGSEDAEQSHALFNYNVNTSFASDEHIYSSINVGLFTWLQINNTRRSKHTTNTMLRTQSNHGSILLSTNAGSEKVSKILRTQMSKEFPMQKLGTPECDEFLFLNSLEQDDFTMNALMFQYEWRRRYGMNIVVRLGRDPVQTCASIEKIAREVYAEYLRPSSNPSFD